MISDQSPSPPKDALCLPLLYYFIFLVIVCAVAAAVDPGAVGLPLGQSPVLPEQAYVACKHYFYDLPPKYAALEHTDDINDFLNVYGNPLIPLVVYRTGLCGMIERRTSRIPHARWLGTPTGIILSVLVCILSQFYYTSLLAVIFRNAIPNVLGFGHFNFAEWFGGMYSQHILEVWAYKAAYALGTCALILWLRRLSFKSWFVYLWLFIAIAEGAGLTAPSSQPRPTRLTASPRETQDITDLEIRAGLPGIPVFDRVFPHEWFNAETVQHHGHYRIYMEPGTFKYLQDNEFRAEVAHELGHVHFDHSRKDYLIDLMFGLYSWLMIGLLLDRSLRESKSSTGKPFEQSAQAIPVIILVVYLTQISLLPLQNAIYRQEEAMADDYAIGLTGYAGDTAALQSRMSYAELHSHPLPVLHFLLDSHPTCEERFDHAVREYFNPTDGNDMR